jgi:RNA polymerase sigma-70 factor (ECF subfamily)
MISENSADRDTYLLELLKKGSAEAFEEIFRKYWHSLYLKARAKTMSHDEAEEIVQSIFSTLWERRTVTFITHLSFYLHTAVRNRVINVIRQHATQQKYCEHYVKFLPQEQRATEAAVNYNELNGAVEAAIDHLPERSRKVFRLSRLEGRSNAEIAKLLHVSEKAIEYHITKSMRTLRVHLKDYILVLMVVLGA